MLDGNLDLHGVHKPRLVVDASSIMTACAYVSHEEDETEIVFEGRKYKVQTAVDIYETFKGTFVKTLTKLGFSPADVIFVKDPVNSRGNRLRIYPEYKANREPRPPEWYNSYTEAMTKVEQLIKDYGGIIATPKEGYEADDLVAEISNRFQHTVIWTRDRDLQCLDGDIFIEGTLNPPHPSGLIEPNHLKVWKTLVDGDHSDNVPSVKGFGPKKFEQFIEKYGADGLDELASMLENDQLHELDADDLPCLQLILDDMQTAYTTWALLSFQYVPAHRVRWEGGKVNPDRFEPGMEKWWPSKRLITDSNIMSKATTIRRALQSAQHVSLDIETDTPPESKLWLEKNGEKIDTFGSELAGCGLTAGPHSFYFPIRHKDTDNVLLEDLKEVISWIPRTTPILCHRAGGFEMPVLYREFGEDKSWGDHGFLPNVHDTKIAANYVDEVAPTGLKSLSKKWLKYQQPTYEETLAGRSGMFEVTGQEVLDYGLDDTICTDALWNLFTAIMEYERTLDVFVKVEQDCQYTAALAMHVGVDCDLEKVKELADRDQIAYDEHWKKFHNFLMNLTWETKTLVNNVPVSETHRWPGTFFTPLTEINAVQLKRMHLDLYKAPLKTQFRIPEKLAEFFTEQPLAEAILAKELDRLNAEYEARWQPDPKFNEGSPQDVVALMYDALNCPVRIRNKPTPLMIKEGRQGTPSTDEDAVKNAIAFGDVGEHKEAFETLLELKKIRTRFSLFYEKYPVLVHWKDGKLHHHLNQSSTSTRRFSHGAPNLAQLPKKKGKEIRGIITAGDPDYLLSDQDIEAQELKLQAWDCQDANFLSCYLGDNKRNLHSLTGFGIDQKRERRWASIEEFQAAVDAKDELAGLFRHQGKETNFSTSYLCMAKKLGQMLCVSEEEAQEFMDAKALAFPGLMPHIEKYIEICKKRKYSLTFMGGRRHLAVPFSIDNKFDQAKAGRWAWSFRIQGSGGEQTKLIMGRMWRSGVYHKFRCTPVTSVHDEVLNRFHKDDTEAVIPILHACVCADYGGMGIPTNSTPEVGRDFASCKEYKLPEKEEV